MESKKASVEEKIILAAIACVADQGLQSLTIRRVAEMAGVNSAAINYYFRSKDKLVAIVLSRTMREMITLPEEILADATLGSKERVVRFFNALMDGVILYPGITIAHIYEPLVHRRYASEFVDEFNRFMEDTAGRIAKLIDGPDENLKTAVIQIVSAVIFPSLMPKMFKSYAPLDLEKAEDRSRYVELLVSRLLPQLK
ncbi:MAG: TetR/AcrR family transcriptional regulator [Candidatus Aminicenantales bacterium]